MTPLKLNPSKLTAVKRDSNYQDITIEGQTGTNTSEAQEEYRNRGMTKVENES